MAEQSKGKDRESAKKGGMIVLIAVGLVIIVLLGAVVVLLLRGSAQEKGGRDPGVEARGTLVTEENVEELFREEVSPVHIPQRYTVTMNTLWNFPDGSSPAADAEVTNVESNETPVYFDVQLADTEETIYESPVIPLGGTLRDITLMRDLDAGSYSCVVIYHQIDDDLNTLTTVRVGLTIVIAS